MATLDDMALDRTVDLGNSFDLFADSYVQYITRSGPSQPARLTT